MNRRYFFQQLATGLAVVAPGLFLPKLIKPAWKASSNYKLIGCDMGDGKAYWSAVVLEMTPDGKLIHQWVPQAGFQKAMLGFWSLPAGQLCEWGRPPLPKV